MSRIFDSDEVALSGWFYQHSVPSDFVSYVRTGNKDCEAGQLG